MTGKGHILLFSFSLFSPLFFFFFFFFFSIHARLMLDLHLSDSKALSTLQKDVGVNEATDHHPCNTENVFREQSASHTATKRHILAETSAEATSHKKNSTVATYHHHKNRLSKRKLAWFVAGALACTIFGFVFSLGLFRLALALFKRGGGGGRGSGTAIFSPLIENVEDLAFLEREEDGLASMEIIGSGGCGEVYKAELSNGKMIAIKKIVLPPKYKLIEKDSKGLGSKMRQIRQEIITVGQIRHRNLLPLLAHVPRRDCHYLVYEFMKNGSLHDLLVKVDRGERELDWLSRHKIAVGVTAGLQYLHTGHSPCIIHRDLKPANILLDNDMEARIADFGLARAMPEAQTHIRASKVAGTAGYIAPECHRMLKFTDKCDIYSFGVVLGALVIGKLPSDEFFQHTVNLSLVKWMRKVLASENPKEAIDARLMGNGYEEQMLLVLKIASLCTMNDPEERPNSNDVWFMLSQIRH